MAILNFAASVAFAYAAISLGEVGDSVGYAIFNTVSVAVALLTDKNVGKFFEILYPFTYALPGDTLSLIFAIMRYPRIL